MYEDMSEDEQLRMIELRFGITKTVGTNPSNDKVDSVETELVSILSKYRENNKIVNPIPKIRMWLTNDKLNFMFFDRKSGKRVLLGDWISNRETSYEK